MGKPINNGKRFSVHLPAIFCVKNRLTNGSTFTLWTRGLCNTYLKVYPNLVQYFSVTDVTQNVADYHSTIF